MIGVHGPVFPGRVAPPVEALRHVCAWCGQVEVENRGDFCPACEPRPAVRVTAQDQASLEEF